ncbi:MAG: ArnT family glycosyltransferase [Steroidobacteraceae bacterium]
MLMTQYSATVTPPLAYDRTDCLGKSFGRLLTIILILAFLVRVAYSLGVSRGVLHIQPELENNDGYHLIAQTLFEGHGYRFSPDKPLTLQRAPAYPAFLLAIFSVAGVNYVWVQIAQAALGSLSCWLLFLLGRWVLSTELGLTAAAMYAFYPNSILYSARLYSENLYFPLFLAFAYLLCRASFEGSVRRGFAVGVAWGAGLLTRGTLLPLLFVLPLGIVLSRTHRQPVSRWLRWATPALLGGMLVLAPWTIRNYSLTGHFVPVSSWSWGPMYQGMQVAKQANEWRDLSQVDMDAGLYIRELTAQQLGRTEGSIFLSSNDEISYDQVAHDLTLKEWAANPLALIKRALRGLFYTWFFAFGTGMRLASLAIHLPILALFVTGAVQMSRHHGSAFIRAWPALGLIIFVNVFYAFAFPHVRYMTPAIALSFIFAALPVFTLVKWWRRPDAKAPNAHQITAA